MGSKVLLLDPQELSLTAKSRSTLYVVGVAFVVAAVLGLLFGGVAGGLIFVLSFVAAYALIGVARRPQLPGLWAQPRR